MHNISKAGFPLEMRLCLPTLKGFTVVKLEEIAYCEAQRSYTIFRLINNKSIMVSKPLFDYDKLLSRHYFPPCTQIISHQSASCKRIYAWRRWHRYVMNNGMEIEVSRRKKEQFLVKMKEFFKY